MLRRFVLAATVMVCTFAFAYSETLNVRIYSVDGNTVTYKKTKKDDTGKTVADGDNIKGTAAADVVVEKAGINAKKKKTDATPLEGGLKNELFSKAGDKGVAATIEIADDGANKGKITKISTKAGGKKGGA